MHPLLGEGRFTVETEDSARARYHRFGADFFARLFAERPGFERQFKFYRHEKTDDVYAICDATPEAFGVQLDPDTEVVCVWDQGWFCEIGKWEPDPVRCAVEIVCSRYGSAGPAPAMKDAPPLDDLGFSFRQRKNGDVEILHHGRLASTLRGADAADFVAEAASGSQAEAQQLMARVTGNYKRGNERLASDHPRNRR